MSGILGNIEGLASNVGNAVSSFFQPKSSFIPSSQITGAFNSAYSGNSRYDLQPNGQYVENAYGKTMDQLDQLQRQIQPSINNANYYSALADLGYTSTNGSNPTFPYGSSLTALPTSTAKSFTGNTQQEGPPSQADTSSQDLQYFQQFWNMFQDQNPYDYFYPAPNAVNTSAYSDAANTIGQKGEADQWLSHYL